MTTLTFPDSIMTSTSLVLPIIHDVSSNGYILNGVRYDPEDAVVIEGKTISRRTAILRNGDEIRLPYDDRKFKSFFQWDTRGEADCFSHLPLLTQ